MFGNTELKERVVRLENKFDVVKQELRNEFDLTVGQLENDTDKKLIEFHKEVTERYFETLEKIFRLNKEISLINTLAGSVKDKDFADLKAQMMQPLLEARWEEKKKELGKKVETQGEWVIEERQRLHNEALTLERHNQPIEKIDKVKERIAMLDEIIVRAKR